MHLPSIGVGLVLALGFWPIIGWLLRGLKLLWTQYLSQSKLFQWPAMLMVGIGLAFLNKRHCQVMRYENRIWVSPNAKRFELPVDSQ